MKLKANLAAAALAVATSFGAATNADAAVVDITDGDGDGTMAGLAPVILNLDAIVGVNAADGIFAATSTEYQFLGLDSSAETFNFTIVNSPLVFFFGELSDPADFTTAQITVAGLTIDLRTNPLPEQFSVGVAGAFTVVTNFVAASGRSGTFDFTVSSVPVSAVPLPAGLILLLTGLGGMAFVGRRRMVA